MLVLVNRIEKSIKIIMARKFFTFFSVVLLTIRGNVSLKFLILMVFIRIYIWLSLVAPFA